VMYTVVWYCVVRAYPSWVEVQVGGVWLILLRGVVCSGVVMCVCVVWCLCCVVVACGIVCLSLGGGTGRWCMAYTVA
jgi:hypothetical protein